MWKLVGSNISDSLSTYAALGLGGIEANPVMGGLMSATGIEAALTIKVAAAFLIGWALLRRGKSNWLVWLSISFAVIAVVNSIQVFSYLT